MIAGPARAAAFLLLGQALGACLPIPHRHLKRPEVAFRVHDSSGHAIPRARLTVYTGNILGKSIQERAPIPLDSLGRGYLEGKSEWHLFMIFIPDAEAPWVWAWCVDAPGYHRAADEFVDEPGDTVRIRLTEDPKSQPCAADPHSLYDVNVAGVRRSVSLFTVGQATVPSTIAFVSTRPLGTRARP